MAKARHLSRAPITEAIIDFRVKSSAGSDPDRFPGLREQLSKSFPKVEERRAGQITFQLTSAGPRPPEFEELGLQGLFFKSDDEKLIAQFRVDGFTLNRLSPYTSWEALFPTAIELWGFYVTAAKPEAVTRLALRYINRIPLPSDQGNLARYLRASPAIPPELPQLLGAFFSRVTIHDPEREIAAHIVQALETDAMAKKATLILDIDAFKELDKEPGDGAIRGTLDQLHAFKNLIFFSYVSDETLEQFE